MKTKLSTKTLVLAALFAATVAVTTAFTAFPIMGGNGYIHVGDIFVLLAASVLPAPVAAIACGIGGALADTMAGFALYILPTALIKAAMAYTFAKSKNRLLGVVLAVIILCGGYYITEVFLFGSFISPLSCIPWNLIQGAFGAAGYFLLASPVRKLLDKLSIQ
ncbi:MAG: ECF transporter S component [Oscillospiraceae bacterium]|nr:ECF transporter S component [Oscillospiraceae bacterium]